MKNVHFTLLEIVVSLAILGLSITGLLTLLTSSQRRLADAQEKWLRMHMLTQAAEYFMLQDEDPPGITEVFFPYPGYRATASYEDMEDGQLPDDHMNLVGQLPLKTLVVTLVRESDGSELDKLQIDRISYESAAGREN